MYKVRARLQADGRERIAELVGRKISPVLASGVTLAWVSVEEAPGCIARWYPADPGLESEQ